LDILRRSLTVATHSLEAANPGGTAYHLATYQDLPRLIPSLGIIAHHVDHPLHAGAQLGPQAHPAITILPLPVTLPASSASRIDTEMYRALEQVSLRRYQGSTVLRSMSTGDSDQAQLRAKGIQSYGIGAGATVEDRTNFGAHSDVERLLKSSLYEFVEFTWTAMTTVAISK
jgi:hypothetical protein